MRNLHAGEKDGDPGGLPVPGVINPPSPGQRQMLIRLINFKSGIKSNDEWGCRERNSERREK